jgi:hypothetical protein
MRRILLLPLFLALLFLPYFLFNTDDGGEGGALAGSTAEAYGHEQTVFDWSRDACELMDIPDSPARAFRDQHGRIKLIAPHFTSRFMVGPSLDSVRRRCHVAMQSGLDPDPAKFDDKEWLTSPYTRDGKRIFTLVHQEYQGTTHTGACTSMDYKKCWYNSITLAMSRDGGASFDQSPPPEQLVASLPYRYQPDVGPFGLFQPSNILLNPMDGYFYAFIRAESFGIQPSGSCLLRTRRLRDSESWRAWDGRSFKVRFSNPYRLEEADIPDHLCSPVAPAAIQAMTDSLTYNTYFKKFMLVGVAAAPRSTGGDLDWGFYFSLSDDLLNWSPRKLISEVELPWTYRCGDRDPVLHPSILDPDSRSRNFLTVDRDAYLYFVRPHYQDCQVGPDRDLVRVPIRFSK